MITALMAIVTVYFVIKLYISVMQVGYINRVKRMPPVLMGSAAYMKAANYAVAKEKLKMVGMFIEYFMFLVWLDGGIQWLDRMTLNVEEPYKSIVMVLGFVYINALVELPLTLYEKFVLDEKFGFNRTSVALYLKDTAVTIALVTVLGGLVIWGVSAIITSTGLWWLWTFFFLFAVVIVLNMFYPTIRALFFDKLSPLEDRELNEKIEGLMHKTGFVSSGVFVSDASKRDSRLNAYFGGLGKSKRVVLFDTLLEKLTPQELLAVLGHELGHYAHGDLYKNIGVVGVLLFVMLAIFGNLPSIRLHKCDGKPMKNKFLVLFITAMCPLICLLEMS